MFLYTPVSFTQGWAKIQKMLGPTEYSLKKKKKKTVQVIYFNFDDFLVSMLPRAKESLPGPGKAVPKDPSPAAARNLPESRLYVPSDLWEW